MDLSSLSNHLAGPAAFASGIFILGQLRQNVNQEIRQLIAQYNMRYLEVARRIPYEILVENRDIDSLTTDKQAEAKRALYDYFLLCDEQLILVNGRTFKKRKILGPLSQIGTWVHIRDVRVWEQAETEWTLGIKYNFRRSAVIDVFEEISRLLEPEDPNESFSAIRRNILEKDKSTAL
jgi:hypothetical protein